MEPRHSDTKVGNPVAIMDALRGRRLRTEDLATGRSFTGFPSKGGNWWLCSNS